MSFFLDFRSRSHFRGPGKSLRSVTWLGDVKSNLIRCFVDFLSRCTRQSLMLLYAHALLHIVTKKYHKHQRTTSTANIKVKSCLLGYKTIPLAAVTLCACVVANCHQEVPQAWAYNIQHKYKAQLFHCAIEHISWLPVARALLGVWESLPVARSLPGVWGVTSSCEVTSGCEITSGRLGESLPGVWGLVTEYCALIGQKGSRDQTVTYLMLIRSRDLIPQYLYWLSRALIGYYPYEPCILLSSQW